MNDRLTSNFTASDEARVMITMNQNQQYLTQGNLNGRSVRFLVDTGASVVSLDANMAAELGVSLDGARKGWAQTAGG